MKKWILILVLAVALVAAVMLASRNTPAGGETPSDDFSTTESTGTEETGDSIESTLTYEEYQNMSGPDRQAHLESFSSMDAFLNWLNAAKADYEADQATRPTINGDEPIDIGDLIGGNTNTDATGDSTESTDENNG